MRSFHSFLSLACLLGALTLAGCGDKPTEAQPIADPNDIDAYLAEHPELDVDDDEDMYAEDDVE